MRKLFCKFLLVLASFIIQAGAYQYSRLDFPPDFVFGAGTSAYQVEGAANEDGRTPSIFDTFAHSGVTNGANGDVACDQYHKYKEDVQLMAETNLEAYRFSISWSRLIPNGRGPVNPKGLQYYNNLIDELISHGIQPHVTLHHDDLPQALEDEYGGWINRRVVEDFTAYAEVCFKEFGDRVKHWTTFNEANVFVLGGYDVGFLPPQRCSFPFGVSPFGTSLCLRGNSSTEPYLATHNILLAHASAAKIYRTTYQNKQKGFIGFNLFAYHFSPYTNSTEDLIATQRAYDFYVGWFADPLVYGDYPMIVKKNVGSRIPSFTTPESDLVKGSFDFLGINFYQSVKVADDSRSLDKAIRDYNADTAVQLEFFSSGAVEPGNSSVFEVTPWALTSVLEYLKQTYGNPPIYIHENGISLSHWRCEPGRFVMVRELPGTGTDMPVSQLGLLWKIRTAVTSPGQQMRRNSTLEDSPRVELLQGYIGAVLDSLRNGSNMRGYFMWSFMDLFELLDGYNSGFGLYYVDLDDPDLKRYPKLSARWYSDFLKGGTVGSGSKSFIEQLLPGNSTSIFS